MGSDSAEFSTGRAPGSEYRQSKGASTRADRDVRRYCIAVIKGDAGAQLDLGYLYAVRRHGRIPLCDEMRSYANRISRRLNLSTILYPHPSEKSRRVPR
jgi:hypothetical protein